MCVVMRSGIGSASCSFKLNTTLQSSLFVDDDDDDEGSMFSQWAEQSFSNR